MIKPWVCGPTNSVGIIAKIPLYGEKSVPKHNVIMNDIKSKNTLNHRKDETRYFCRVRDKEEKNRRDC